MRTHILRFYQLNHPKMASLSADGNPGVHKPATPPPDHDVDSNFVPNSKKPSPYDPNYTARVIAATGANAIPRLARIMPALLRHLHDFAREVDLTMDEFTLAMDYLNECGKFSTDRRNEMQLLFDILGLESLADEISSVLVSKQCNEPEKGNEQQAPSEQQAPTPSTVLGPFHREGAPLLPNGSSIVKIPDSIGKAATNRWVEDSTFVSGQVVSARSGLPIADAVIDIWHSAPNGMYEQQDPSQDEMNCRGRFKTDRDGRYSLYCLKPVPYPVPNDGPAGKMLTMLDRSPMRPGHIHFVLEKEGYRRLITQVFDRRDKYLDSDTVFAVKPELVVEYLQREGDENARWELEYDFRLDEDEENDDLD